MKKASIIKALIIAIVLITVFVWWLLLPPKLSDKIGNRDGMFVPSGFAEEYFCDPFNYSYWKFELNTQEQSTLSEFIKEYSDIWFELSEDSLSYLSGTYPENYKFDFSNIHIEDSHYCFLSTISNRYMCIEEGKDDLCHSIICIWDSFHSTYYCIWQAVR